MLACGHRRGRASNKADNAFKTGKAHGVTMTYTVYISQDAVPTCCDRILGSKQCTGVLVHVLETESCTRKWPKGVQNKNGVHRK